MQSYNAAKKFTFQNCKIKMKQKYSIWIDLCRAHRVDWKFNRPGWVDPLLY